MKLQIIIPFVLLLIQLAATANEYDDKYQLELEARIKTAKVANYKMSDKALLVHIEKMMKYLPEILSDIKNQDKAQKKQTLNNFREYYASAGLSIPEQIESFKNSPELQEFSAKIWANDTLGVEYAEEVLLNLAKQEYQTIIEVAKELMLDTQLPRDRRGRITITEKYPEKLDFINIEMIRISEQTCKIYLYKGIGGMKSIGYIVKQEKNGKWNLYHFNYLNNWDKTLIDISTIQ
ncbi:MAG: hypothetical protein JKY19_04205 [Alcanivoracaceae bacterium]|nr:hypothetical protein [Alcanivoracaceae bacterium]